MLLPFFIRRYLGVGVLALGLVAPSLVWGQSSKPRQSQDQNQSAGCGDHKGRACELFQLTNQVRISHGRPALLSDPLCRQAAQSHAEDMGNRGFYGHYTPEGMDLAKRYTGAWQTVGENIMAGKTIGTDGAIRAWMGSKGHRRNLLGLNFSHLGVGVATVKGQTYYVQCFSVPRAKGQSAISAGPLLLRRYRQE